MVKEGVRSIGWAVLPCNWLQIMENSLDPVHVEWLHRYMTNYALERLGRKDADAHNFWRTRANVQKHVKIGFDIFENGITKRRILEGDDENHPNWRLGHSVLFPNMLQQHQIRVPLDDTHTLYWYYHVYPKREGDADQRPEDIPNYEVPLPGVGKDGLPIWDLMDNNSGQDNYAWMSQGGVTPRWTEHLGESDKGIILYRRLLREQMQLVAEGKDPMNTFRDPAKNVSIHVVSESDDKAWDRRISAGEAGVSTGNSGKYSPITQQRAKKSGFAVPEKVEEYAAKVSDLGMIHAKE
jgi:5,5'-dehydrodivanillate O-demethylase